MGKNTEQVFWEQVDGSRCGGKHTSRWMLNRANEIDSARIVEIKELSVSYKLYLRELSIYCAREIVTRKHTELSKCALDNI